MDVWWIYHLEFGWGCVLEWEWVDANDQLRINNTKKVTNLQSLGGWDGWMDGCWLGAGWVFPFR